ncbi:MAG: LacI family DNA-binding transcriptional regulator [Opitutales bacterium]|nr:LacI family DNA-binding transcriptional regulator [Opitutales bacterium]
MSGEVAPADLEALQRSAAITLRLIAQSSGVSSATVSRALSGHPNVRAEVRDRVLATARQHGYRRNHLVSTIMGQVRGARTQLFMGNLALVHVPSLKQPTLRPMQQSMIKAAADRALELGFRAGVFSLGDQVGGPAALARVLQARGVLGVVFLQPNSNNTTAGFPWNYFTSVQIDYDSPNLVQHTVSLDHHFTLVGALSRLRALGYGRIGLFIERHKDERLVHKWSAAFRSYQENHGGIGAVPVLMSETMTSREFLAWQRTHRPDLVVGHVDRALSWLKRAGLSVPTDIGFFNLNWNERFRPCAGLDLRPELHGAVAVETLAAQIQRNERGMPLNPQTVSILGSWVDGPTLRT